MAETKPTTTPEWNTGAANRTTPNGAKITLGWENGEKPVSSAFMNWLQHWGGRGLKWIYERLDDGLKGGGGDTEDFYLHPPAPAGAGGTMTVSGADADAVAGGAGGAGYLQGGDAKTSGAGGAVAVLAGQGEGAGAGGAATISAGNANGTGNGGAASALGGDAAAGVGGGFVGKGGQSGGTDKNGGITTIASGQPTGDGYGSVALQAADGGQGAGSTLRSLVTYLLLSGLNRRIEAYRPVVLNPSSTPSVGLTNGMRYADSGRASQDRHRTENGWESSMLGMLAQFGDPDLNNSSAHVLSAGQATFPANTLFLNEVIEFVARVRAINGSGIARTFTARVDLNRGAAGPQIVATSTTPSVAAGDEYLFELRGELHITAAGASGTFFSHGERRFIPQYLSTSGQFIYTGTALDRYVLDLVGQSIDTTGANTLDISGNYSGGDEANTGFQVESFRAWRQ